MLFPLSLLMQELTPNRDSLQRSIVLRHVSERSFGADHMLIHGGFLHPHHPIGIFLLFVLWGLAAGVAAGLLPAFLCLLLLGLLRPDGKQDAWLVKWAVTTSTELMHSFVSELTFCSSFSFSSSLFLLLKHKNKTVKLMNLIREKTKQKKRCFSFILPSESDSSSLSSECFLFFLFLDFFFFFFFFFFSSLITDRMGLLYIHRKRCIAVIYVCPHTVYLLCLILNCCFSHLLQLVWTHRSWWRWKKYRKEFLIPENKTEQRLMSLPGCQQVWHIKTF